MLARKFGNGQPQGSGMGERLTAAKRRVQKTQNGEFFQFPDGVPVL